MKGCRNCQDHRLHLKTKGRSEIDAKEVIVVGRSRQTYLWLGNANGKFLTALSGPATLRRVAKAILKEVGA
jgi:hypothetical protein